MAGLIDEYVTVTHPVLVGGGIPFFAALDNWVDLRLVEAQTLPGGVVITKYETKRRVPGIGYQEAETLERFYVAGSFRNIADVRYVAQSLESLGYVNMYDWTQNASARDAGSVTLGDLRSIGQQERDAVLGADVVVILLPGGKGTHVELGIAIAGGKRTILHSPDEVTNKLETTSAFYHLPELEKCHGNLDDLLEMIVGPTRHRLSGDGLSDVPVAVGVDDVLAVTLPIKDWVLIDGTMDNFASIAVLEDPHLAQLALAIRSIGWTQVPGWPSAGDDISSWPPEGEDCTINMSRSRWEFVLAALVDAVPIELTLADEERSPSEQRTMHAEVASRIEQIIVRLRGALQ